MATSTARALPPLRPPSEAIPPLENGDRLTRDEFERRFDAMPDLKKAELIEGVVFMGSPVRALAHGTPHADAVCWLNVYRAATPGVLIVDNASVRLDPENVPQPDVALLIDRTKGGQATLSDDDYIEGSPELVVEIAASTVSHDLHDKLDVYQRSGVREYLTWRVLDGAFDWRVLREGRYESIEPDADGLFKSEVFPGLWLDPSALLRGDLAAVLETLRRGAESPEHAAFAAQLRG